MTDAGDQLPKPDTEPRPAGAGGRPRRDDITPARVRELRALGLSFRQIANRVSAGYGAVRKAYRQSDDAPQASESPKAEVL
jgi:transposase